MTRLSEDQLHFLFEHSMEAVLLTAPDGRILAANPAACLMFGWTEEEICKLGRNGIVDITDPRLPAILEERNKNGNAKGELNFKRKDGSLFPGEMSSALFTDNSGSTLSSIIIRDVSHYKHIQANLLDAVKKSDESEKVKADLLQKLNEAQHTAKIGSWEWNFKSNTIWWSDELYYIFEVEPSDYIPSMPDSLKFLHPDDLDSYSNEIERVIKEKQVLNVDFKIITALGNIKFCNAKAKVEFDVHDAPLRMYGTVMDISSQKITEALLFSTEEKFKSALDSMFEGYQIIGFDWKYNYMNEAVKIQNRRPYEELIGQRFMDVWPGIENTELFKVLKDSMDNRVKHKFENNFSFPTGENGWFELIIQPIPEGIFIFSVDITDRKSAELALRKSEERLRLSLRSANQGLYDLNIQTGEIIVNDEYALMLGYDPSTFVETKEKWDARLHPDDKNTVETAFDECISGGLNEYRIESRQKTADGDWKWILSIGKIQEYDNEGKPLRMVGIHTDITQKKRHENNEKLANEILNILNHSQDTMLIIRDIIETIKKRTTFEAVAIRLKDGGEFPYFSTSAVDEEFAKTEQSICTSKTDGSLLFDNTGKAVLNCICGLIFTGKTNSEIPHFTDGGSFMINNITELLNENTQLAHLATINGPCFHLGYKSVALIPIHSGSEVIGLLQLNDKKENAFAEDTISYFEGLLSSIGIAIKRNQAEHQLIVNEEKYRSIFENVNDVFYQTDLNGIITDISPSIKKFSDFSREELIGTNVIDLYVNPEDRNALVKFIFEHGEVSEYEVKLKNNKGEIKYAAVTARLIRNSKNEPEHIDGALRDVTMRRLAEENLLLSEERFRTLFEHNLSIMLLIDPVTGSIEDANYAAENFYGWTREQMIQMRIQDINTLGEAIKPILEKAKKEKQLRLEFSHRKADGSIHDVEVFYSNIELLGKDHLHSIVHDITDRKVAEKQLKLLNRAIEQSPVSVMITDKESKLVYVNPSFTRITGYESEEVIGQNIRIVQSGLHSKKFYKELWNVILSGKVWRGEFQNKKKNGELYWEKSVISSILNSNGEIAFFIAVQEDITTMKKLTHELILAKEKAEESDFLKTAFLHNISHEIRTPINAIVGFSEFLMDKQLDSEKREKFLRIIIESSNQLLNVINDIVNMASLETGQEPILEKNININSLLTQLHKIYQPKAKEKSLDLQFFTPLNNEEATVLVDDNKLFQVLSNITNNAIKFTKAGFVSLGYVLKDSFIEFYVKDSGIGIPPDVHQKIFHRFMQVDNSHTRTYGGPGLGLAIARAYIELLGGKIWLESQPNKGSEFYFTIPYKKDQTVIVDIPHSAPMPLTKPKSILIAEDEEFNYLLLEEIFQSMNIELTWADDGQKAVDLCYSGKHFDLILMDLKMPYLSGFEAITLIRKILPTIPIIVQTAYDNYSEKQKAFACGCNDFITKPFHRKEILHKLQPFLED